MPNQSQSEGVRIGVNFTCSTWILLLWTWKYGVCLKDFADSFFGGCFLLGRFASRSSGGVANDNSLENGLEFPRGGG